MTFLWSGTIPTHPLDVLGLFRHRCNYHQHGSYQLRREMSRRYWFDKLLASRQQGKREPTADADRTMETGPCNSSLVSQQDLEQLCPAAPLGPGSHLHPVIGNADQHNEKGLPKLTLRTSLRSLWLAQLLSSPILSIARKICHILLCHSQKDQYTFERNAL